MQFNLNTPESKRDRMNRLHIDALSALVSWASQASDESELVERIETVNKRMTAQNYQHVRDQFDAAARDAYAANNAAQDDDSTDTAPDTPESDSAPVEAPKRRKAA
jgi:hypothetical protein